MSKRGYVDDRHRRGLSPVRPPGIFDGRPPAGTALVARDLRRDGAATRSTLAAWDSGSRQRAIGAVQRSAGNRAAATTLGAAVTPRAAAAPQAATASSIGTMAAVRPGLSIWFPLDFEAIAVGARAARASPAAPPAGARRIRDERGGGSQAAGYTELPAPQPPELVVGEPARHGSGWAARVQPTSAPPAAPLSLYPAPGVHDLGVGEGGQQRHLDVTPEMSTLIRQGEEEHLTDLEWARYLSYERVAATINAVAEAEPPVAGSAAEARRLAAAQVCQALPPQLRWTSGQDPLGRWLRAYSRLAHVTIERDTNDWHDMTTAFILDPAEKRRLGLPVEHELRRYMGGPEIGRHPSAPLVRARFAELAE